MLSSVGSPARRDSSTSRSRSSTPGWGEGGAASGSSPARRTFSSWRISRRASRPEDSRVTRASRTTSGLARLARAPPDISCMVVMWWATMSCSSRAMRRRSSATARSASSWRLAVTSRCQREIARPPAATSAVEAVAAMASPQPGTPKPLWLSMVVAAVAALAAAVTRPLQCRATEYTATVRTAPKCAPIGASTLARLPSTRTAASVPTGRWRRASSGRPDSSRTRKPGTLMLRSPSTWLKSR